MNEKIQLLGYLATRSSIQPITMLCKDEKGFYTQFGQSEKEYITKERVNNVTISSIYKSLNNCFIKPDYFAFSVQQKVLIGNEKNITGALENMLLYEKGLFSGMKNWSKRKKIKAQLDYLKQ